MRITVSSRSLLLLLLLLCFLYVNLLQLNPLEVFQPATQFSSTPDATIKRFVSLNRTHHLYIGDSRILQMCSAHLRTATAAQESSCVPQNCGKEDEHFTAICSSQERVVNSGNDVFRYFACGSTDAPCFRTLSGENSRINKLLKLKRDLKYRIYIGVGTSDILNGTASIEQIKSSLLDVLGAFQDLTPRSEITWVGVFPLITPAPDAKASFGDLEQLNKRISTLRNETNSMARAFNLKVFDVTEIIGSGSLPYRLSPDSIHLYDDLVYFVVNEMRNASNLHLMLRAYGEMNISSFARFELTHPLNARQSGAAKVNSDIYCGSRPLRLPTMGSTVKVAFFGGSVTSDGKMINGFKENAKKYFRWEVSEVNLGEAGTDSTYRSYCLVQASRANVMRDIQIAVIEYCANDHDLNATRLEQLIRGVMSLPSSPLVLYYCHRGPGSRLSRSDIPKVHWDLVKTLGVLGARSNHILINSLRREDALLFRDKVHLTPYGGQVIGALLVRALHECTTSSTDNASLPSVFPRKQVELNESMCYSSLGPEESRNMDKIVDGWRFVQYSHRSAPNGKNGYEPRDSNDILTIRIHDHGGLARKVIMFYLASNDPSMRSVNVTIDGCPDFVQTIHGFWNRALRVISRTVIELPRMKCSNLSHIVFRVQLLPLNTIPMAHSSSCFNTTCFRMVAVAVEH